MAESRPSNRAGELQLQSRGHRVALARPAMAVPVVASAALAMVWSHVVVGLLVVACLLLAIRSPAIGARFARWNARRRREGARRRSVHRTGALREQQYEELRDLVDACDERDVARFDLEGLLDAFASTALAHHRQVKALELATSSDTLIVSSRRHQIRARRMRYREACLLASNRLEDDLASIDDLVRLIVQRIATPTFDPDVEHEIDRRLADLDELDRVYGELAEETA